MSDIKAPEIRHHLEESFNWRYAVKKFDSTKKISEEDWKVLSESLRMTASSYGLQPWKFIIVQNPEVRKQLTPHSWNQTQVEDCSHYVVLVNKKKMDETHIQKYVNHMAEVRGIQASALDGFKSMMLQNLVQGSTAEKNDIWAQKQVYIAMGSLLLAAAELRIDACPMEGVDPAAYDKILGLENTGWGVVATVACGYRHAEDPLQKQKKVRFPSQEVIQIV